jgi:hypothetical protein
VASESGTNNSRKSGNVKAKIKSVKPKKKKNEVAQPLAQDVILGKVDYDGSVADESEAT